jgi:hypothetical protein
MSEPGPRKVDADLETLAREWLEQEDGFRPSDAAYQSKVASLVALLMHGMALVEAERILANTEPLSPGWGTIELAHVDHLSHNERAALAEGIAGLITALHEMSHGLWRRSNGTVYAL